jgi:hypothetical protein
VWESSTLPRLIFEAAPIRVWFLFLMMQDSGFMMQAKKKEMRERGHLFCLSSIAD